MKMLISVLCSLMAALTIPVATAQMAEPANPPATAELAKTVSFADGYVIGTGDVIEVAVLGRQDFSGRIQVQVDGTVQLPLIGDVPAANRTVFTVAQRNSRGIGCGPVFY